MVTSALSPIVEPSELVASIERARALLDDGDVEAALMLASGVYEQAKAAGGYAQKVKVSRELVDKARRMQAEALKIESICYVAMADAVDAAQAKGELARPGRKTNISGENVFTLDEVGLDAQAVHQARKLRNAERAEPGFIERVVEARLEEGLEPSRASLKTAAGHAIGTKTASKDERGEDLYETPIEAVRTLLALESFVSPVFEPSVGRGAIMRPLEAAGYDVRISDLVDRGIATKHGELQGVGDFLSLMPDADFAAGQRCGPDIVTNPPYGVANAYIAHALKAFRPGKMAMLLNLNFLAGFDDPDRCFVMDENPPSRIYVFTRRLPMMHRDGWEGNKASSQMNTAWFVWERALGGTTYGNGYPQLIRVDWQAFQDAPALAPGEGGHVSPSGFAVRKGEEDDDLQRETPRKSLDERVEEERARALVWAAEQDGFDAGQMRRGLGLRPSTVDALIGDFHGRGFIAFVEDRYRITQDGWAALTATAGALAGLAALDALDGAEKADRRAGKRTDRPGIQEDRHSSSPSSAAERICPGAEAGKAVALLPQTIAAPLPIARDVTVDALLSENAPVAIGVSGGKDSQAAALATFRHLDSIGHAGPRILIHADLGSVEWNNSFRICEELADRLRCDLVVVRRKAGGLMERWESRWLSSKTRYEQLSTVTLVPCWSTPDMRFCTSEQKTHVITAELRRRFKGQTIINVTGVRHEESRNRARMPIADADSSGRLINWRPIIHLTSDEVFDLIDSSGLQPHPAYRIFGMGRVSCRFCIMSNIADMTAASGQAESHDLYRQMVQLEIDSSFAFQGARWLGDVAAHILTPESRDALAVAKQRAIDRKEIEARITKPMLYVKGWPTRMLTDDEADILAGVRRSVADLYGFEPRFIDRHSIHARYVELIDARAGKAVAS